MKAVITGATGHVGVNLAKVLLSQGHQVRAVVRKDVRGLEGLDVEKFSADVRDAESLFRAFEGRDVVFHAAAQISITAFDRSDVLAINLQGTRNVLSAFRGSGARRLVHFSSIEALSPRPLDVTLDEERPFVSNGDGSPYARSKAQAEAEVRSAAAGGLDVVIINPTAIIGPNDWKPSLLGSAVIAMAKGSYPMLIEGGFDWVDVRDIAEAAVCAAETARAGSRYIIGGRWASMAELAELVCAVSGARPPRMMCPFPIAQAWAPISTAFCRVAGRAPLFTSYTLKVLRGNKSVSHARAERELGYHPRELAQSVRDTCFWFQEKGLLPKT
ncbi:MAG: NAD-dependent epimerase/dehydratase family protein [Spirochaetia bacterium]|jgi:dihydroflavonol-4-reductase